MKKFALFLILVFYYGDANATMCHNKKYSLLEVLHDVDDYSIFEILIDSTNETHLGTISYGKVLKTYKGESRENIKLITKHQFSPGGYFLIPGDRYFIFATYDENEAMFHAMTCDYYSHPIPPNIEYKMWSKERVLYMDIVIQWKSISVSKYSGYKEYMINNNVIAKGKYKYGKPHGLWHYYNYDQNTEHYYLDRKVNYNHGVINGKEERWYDHRFKESESNYKMGMLISQKRYTITRSEKNALINKITTSKFKDNLLYKSIWYDTLGNIQQERSYFKNKVQGSFLQWAFTEIFHGKYQGSYYTKSEGFKVSGEMYLGQKVNSWKFYDLKTNAFIKEVAYGNYLPRIDSIVFESLNSKMIGSALKNDKLDGQWRFYQYDNLKCSYNFINGVLHGNVISYNNNYQKVTPYINGLKNGMVYIITNSNDTLYCEKYINNKLDSLQLTYSDKCILKEAKTYKDGLLNGELISYGVDKNDTLFYANYINGMLHGKSFRKSPDDYIEWGSYYRNNKCGLWNETSMSHENKIDYIIIKEKQTGRLSSIDKAYYLNNEWMYGSYEIIDVKSSF